MDEFILMSVAITYCYIYQLDKFTTGLQKKSSSCGVRSEGIGHLTLCVQSCVEAEQTGRTTHLRGTPVSTVLFSSLLTCLPQGANTEKFSIQFISFTFHNSYICNCNSKNFFALNVTTFKQNFSQPSTS